MHPAQKPPFQPRSDKILPYLRPDLCPFRAAQRALAHGETGEAWRQRIAALPPTEKYRAPFDLVDDCITRRRWSDAAVCGGAEALVRGWGPEFLLSGGDDSIWEAIRQVEPKREDASRYGGCWLSGASQAGRVDWLTELLERGVGPNAPVFDEGASPPTCDMRERPLTAAIGLRERECVHALLRAGANPNHLTCMTIEESCPGWFHSKKEARFTPLMLAEAAGDDVIADDLIQHGADPELASRLGLGFLDHHAIRGLRDSYPRQLRQVRSSLRCGTPFHVIAAEIAALSKLDAKLWREACFRGRVDVLAHLIEMGILDEERYPASYDHLIPSFITLAEGGDEVLTLLLANGYRPSLTELCSVGDDVLVRKVLAAGYPPNETPPAMFHWSNPSLTPLMQAVRVGATACAEALIEHGADVNLGVRLSFTGPESYGKLIMRGHYDYCGELGEEPKEYLITPLTLAEAVDNQSAIKLLREHGAKE